MQKGKKVSCLSVVSAVVSVISIIAFCLLFYTYGIKNTIVRCIWTVTGISSLIVPTVAKYFRKKNGLNGRTLEIIALILGFFGCDNVLVYQLNLENSIDIFVVIALCVIYAKLFNHVEANGQEDLTEQKPQIDQIVEDGNAIICKKCGNKIDAESAYCKYCGKKVIGARRHATVINLVPAFSAVCCILVIGIYSVYCLINYKSGIAAMNNSQFISAQRYFGRIPLYQTMFPDEFEYIQAGILAEQGDYIEALKKFSQINYPVPISTINNIKKELYYQSKEYYSSGEYQTAKKGFSAIPNYKNSKDYILLAKCHLVPLSKYYNDLLELIGFEDAAEIILYTDSFFKIFLKDEWKSETGGYFFKIDSNGSSYYNLPSSNVYGGYYSISSGMYIETDSKGAETKQFKFTIIDENTISAFCYKNNNTYILIRQ